MQFELSETMKAPIDLVWEFIAESTFEQDACPISGLIGGEILQEYEDGLLRYVIFGGVQLKQRVKVIDADYTLLSDFSDMHNQEKGSVTNKTTDHGDHVTSMHIHCTWQQDDPTGEYEAELKGLFQDRLKRFKHETEALWAEKGAAALSVVSSEKTAIQ